MWPVSCVHASAIGLSLFTTSFNLGRHLPSLEGTTSSSSTFYGSQREAQRPVALQPPAIFFGKSSSSFSVRFASFTIHRRISPKQPEHHLRFQIPWIIHGEQFHCFKPFSAVGKTSSSDTTFKRVTAHLTHPALSSRYLSRESDWTTEFHLLPSFPPSFLSFFLHPVPTSLRTTSSLVAFNHRKATILFKA